MSMDAKGKVLTVLGPKEPTQLGIVLPHEQPMVDLTKLLIEPPPGHEYLKHLQLEMKTLGDVRHYPYSVLNNLIIDSEEEVLTELKLYKKAGGGTLCDVSPVGVRLKRDSLPRISRETGLNIVAGTAFYVEPLMPEEVKMMSVQQRSQFLVDEIVHGISGCGVRCGFIGEVGCSSPLTDNEKKSLQAAALAQKKTGAPLMIHPGPTEDTPFKILDILESSGADTSHTVIAHLDRTICNDQTLLKLAQRGCYLEFDLFGTECSHYQLVPQIDFPSDAQQIQKVKLLVDNGYVNQVLISTDIHSKHRMACYGGHGYSHIVEHIVPKMKDRGIATDDVTRIITTNPQTWLTFK